MKCVCLTKVTSRSKSYIKVKHTILSALSFEHQVGFTNNSEQMSRMIDLSRCAVHEFDQGRFKVKVIRLNTVWLYKVSTLKLLKCWYILEWVGANLKYHEMMCRAHLWPRSLQGQGQSSRQTNYCVCSRSFEPLVGFTNKSAQMSSMMRWCAVRMFDQGRFKVKIIF